MDFIIVANDDLAPMGRQLAHALSKLKGNSGAFWTVKYYKDNEPQIKSRQPVIFLGDNEVANSYVGVLPERFRGFGTTCSFEGAKAILLAKEPSDVSREDMAGLTRAVEGNREELRNRAASAASGIGAEGNADAFMINFYRAFDPLGIAEFFIRRFMSAQKRKRDYRKLQYDYALSRFLKDEFEAFIGGVEGR